jgi:trehalose 6-phosphate phosphatase
LEASVKVSELPDALRDAALWERLSKASVALFLDYDGTLTQIVKDPRRAVLPPKTKAILERLSLTTQVVIVSGRDAEDVRSLVDLPRITYVGCHGFDIIDRNGKLLSSAPGDEFGGTLSTAKRKLEDELSNFPGILIEVKKHGLAVHFRNARAEDIPELTRRFVHLSALFPNLKLMEGKKVLELLPNADWNKGMAFLTLYDGPEFQQKKIVPIFIGDDQTDEDAFYAIRNKGIGIVVGRSDKKKTWAKYYLDDYLKVESFLRKLADRFSSNQSQAVSGK